MFNKTLLIVSKNDWLKDKDGVLTLYKDFVDTLSPHDRQNLLSIIDFHLPNIRKDLYYHLLDWFVNFLDEIKKLLSAPIPAKPEKTRQEEI